MPERTISQDEAARCLSREFPDLPVDRIELLGNGWDNSAFLVESRGLRWVFRFPRRGIAVQLIRTEAAVLPRIAGALPTPIPVPDRVGAPGPEFPWPFAGYRWLPGRTACRLGLDDDARTALAPALGRFLRALHAQPIEPLLEAGLPPDELRRLDPEKRLPQLEERLGHAERLGLIEGAARCFEAAATVREAGAERPIRADVLVHGDLDLRHLLIGDRGELAGVIDWGDVHAGDPAEDLGLALGFLPPRARAAFVRDYGGVDDATWSYARLKAIFLAAAVVVYAADTGDDLLIREGRRSLENALED